MPSLPISARVPFSGRIMRDGPHLVPHSMAFPSAMVSLKVLMGGKHRTHDLSAHNRTWRSDDDYYLHLGLSGEGFRFLFDTAEYFRFQEPQGAQPVLDCLLAEGIPAKVYAAKPVKGIEGIWRDEAHLKELVLSTLATGYPALLLGRTGGDRVLLATGYDGGGETLAGWMFVPGADMSNKSFDPADCQFMKDWAAGADAAILVSGMPGVVSGRKAIFRRAFDRGQEYLLGAAGHPHGTGCDFYEDWRKALLDEAFWRTSFAGRPRIDPDIWDLAERRAFAAEFLEQAGEALGTTFAPASGFMHEIHDLMWKINSLCDGEDSQAKLRSPAIRREIAAILETCRGLDRKAAEHIGAACGEGNE